MANEVKNLRYDVASRIGENWNPGQILRAMNRVYWRLNRELRCLEKSLSIPAGSFYETVKSYAIPADLLEEYDIIPGSTSKYKVVYVPKEMWNPNQFLNSDHYSKRNGYFEFGSVNSESSFTVLYYSQGLELVDAEDDDYDETLYTNTPEWNKGFWMLLVYEACFELSADYPLMGNDIAHAEQLKSELARENKNRQSNTPAALGKYGAGLSSGNPDRVNGLWVTRL